MKTKAIIFDMNGVFINDSGPLSKRVGRDFNINVDHFHTLLKTALKQVRVTGSKSSLAWQPVLDLLNISYDDFFKYWFKGENLNTKLLLLASSLRRQGIKIIILSNNFPERTNYYRKIYPELFSQVDKQYFSWETGNIKPDPQAILQVINDHNYLPEEYLYFDDKEENLETARKLGVPAYLYKSVEEIKKHII